MQNEEVKPGTPVRRRLDPTTRMASPKVPAYLRGWIVQVLYGDDKAYQGCYICWYTDQSGWNPDVSWHTNVSEFTVDTEPR